eukprot:Gregarina_sp_Poly_1__10049@NODE_676_length_6827_cov_240_110355_g509_i0_p5_GENE_NODE_676_length_6827_cov_240_110355_g509_i0NODE_676_length_6827_cov_240_110355_g509_i0_p5_ORF_typecomplete_len157_score24_68DivIVA/PF05103_13/0_00026DUF4201/PF13870_6/0_00045HOOK/PF05622_12/0_00053Leu_zip/PF15294_6/0_00072UPF0242/PF06785_11/0_00091Atg14/PF10186_9/0_00098HAUSaugmin3/PF14932_6/0_0044DUF724/PF05266_14/0_0071Taxilin/PF09728_9/0_0081ATG16/PF08614_11/0_011MAD/PF05557_13/0_0087Myosin_tail_1/PF01576_19/0_011Z
MSVAEAEYYQCVLIWTWKTSHNTSYKDIAKMSSTDAVIHQFAFRMITNACKNKVAELQSENDQLQSKLNVLELQLAELRDKQCSIERELLPANQVLLNYKQRNSKMANEIVRMQNRLRHLISLQLSVTKSIKAPLLEAADSTIRSKLLPFDTFCLE